MNDHLIRCEHFDLYNLSGNRIHGDIRYKPTLNEKPVIVICHSFMAFKDWGFFPFIAERFAECGYVSIIFNFSGNGVKGDDDRITDFKSFEKNTFLLEVNDLKTVIDSIWNGEIGAGVIDRSNIILLGHSRGGGVAIIEASNDERVKALISWSTIGTFFRWTEHQKKVWRANGFLPLAKDTAASPLRLGTNLLYEIENEKEKLDLLSTAARIKIPWLLIHGKTDKTVPASEAEMLFDAAVNTKTELFLLDHVGHLYNAATIEEDNYKTIEMVFQKTKDWLQKNKMKG
ncbi:MAG: prolyl oligopeptidase family serine peptidase [Ignavibacteriales bacterium]|nr:prolyl oligopeptidase family serine peptidase [Ignavibacteriales bacterium]